MYLQVGKSYNLSTLKNSIVKKKIKVVGVIDYSEAIKIPYNIVTLAINERVIENEGEEYLQNQVYYKCKVLKSDDSEVETSEYLLVWDDIIDTNSTTELNIEYELLLKININSNSDIQINEVLTEISNHLTENYGEMVGHSIKIANSSSNVSINSSSENLMNNMEAMKEMLKEAANTLLSLVSFKDSVETLSLKMNNVNMDLNLDSISNRVNEIYALVNDVYNIVH